MLSIITFADLSAIAVVEENIARDIVIPRVRVML